MTILAAELQRGEFICATRVLTTRPGRAINALAKLCEEGKDEDLISALPYAARRISTLHYTPREANPCSQMVSRPPSDSHRLHCFLNQALDFLSSNLAKHTPSTRLLNTGNGPVHPLPKLRLQITRYLRISWE